MKAYLNRNDKPIELGRPSNVGSLIGAVLVGVLALVTNQYARVGTRMFEQFMQEMDQMQTALVKKISVEEPPKKLPPLDTPELIEKKLPALDKAIEEMFRSWRAKQSAPNPKAICFRDLQRIHEAIDKNPALADSLSVSGRIQLLSASFMASQLAPHLCAESFTRWSDRMAQSKEPMERALAEGLLIYARHDLKRPNVDELCRDLEQHTSKHAHYGISARVYCMIAQELWLRGQLKAAETVLKSGLDIMDGKDERNALVDELMKQQHRLPTAVR